jgi:hypothetical protein
VPGTVSSSLQPDPTETASTAMAAITPVELCHRIMNRIVRGTARDHSRILQRAPGCSSAACSSPATRAASRWLPRRCTGRGSGSCRVAADARPPKEILALATEWATATDGSLDPFSDGILYPFSEEGSATYEAYRSLPSVQNLAEGDQLSRDATCSTFEAQVLSCQGARKGLSTIFLAIALVVGGVAALQRGRLAQNIVLATSVTALIAGPEFSLSRPMSTERELT